MPLDMHSNVTSYHKMGLIFMNNYQTKNQVLFYYNAKYENISFVKISLILPMIFRPIAVYVIKPAIIISVQTKI